MSKETSVQFDPFSANPFLVVLPVLGTVGELEQLTSSLYARYENVITLSRNLPDDVDEGSRKRLAAEEGMLRQVLDWLKVNPEIPNEEEST